MDDSDRIWIGTREGLSLYNHYKDEFSNYYYKRNGLNVAVTSIIPIKKDWLMLGTAEGILLFDVKSVSFRIHYPLLCMDCSRQLWYARVIVSI